MPLAGKKSAFTFSKVSAPKSYDLLASQLREAILVGEIPEGSSLPTERELVSQTGLSRGSVREALRMLAAEGLVQPRQGRLGGNIVSLPGSEALAQFINQFVRGRKISSRILHETREFLEPALAKMAAQRRSAEDLERLKLLQKELVSAVDNFQRFSIVNVQWHNAVADASGNELLPTFLKSMSFGVAVATPTEEYDAAETRSAVIQIHQKINDAIEKQDGDKAESYMRRLRDKRKIHGRIRTSELDVGLSGGPKARSLADLSPPVHPSSRWLRLQ